MESPFKSKSGLERIAKAAGYSMAGLKAAYQNEAAIRQELLLCLFLVPLALYFGHTGIARALLLGSVLLVLVVELLNSAIESVVDLVTLEKHPLAGRAKDIGSAAVFVALMNVLVVWGLVIFYW